MVLGVPAGTGRVLSRGTGFLSRSLGFIFRWKIISFFLIIILIQSISIALSAGDLDEGLKLIATQLITPTIGLQNAAIYIIQNGAIWKDTGNIFVDMWNFISSSLVLITQIYIFFFWIALFAFIVRKSPLSNESNWFINYSLGTIFFFLIQMLYISQANLGSIWRPFESIAIFIKSIPYLINPISDSAKDFINTIQGVKSSVITNNISNFTNMSSIPI